MMDDPIQLQLPLPQTVEELINKICIEKNHPPPDFRARQKLVEAGEETALEVLSKIYNTPKPIKTLGGFIIYMIKQKFQSPNQVSTTPESKFYQCNSPLKRTSPSACASPVSPPAPQTIQNGFGVGPVQDSPIFQPILNKGTNPGILELQKFKLSLLKNVPLLERRHFGEDLLNSCCLCI